MNSGLILNSSRSPRNILVFAKYVSYDEQKCKTFVTILKRGRVLVRKSTQQKMISDVVAIQQTR